MKILYLSVLLVILISFTTSTSSATPSNLSSNVTSTELLHFSNKQYSCAEPLDWSSDGNSLLLEYGVYNTTSSSSFYFLALTNPNLKNVTALSIPYSQQQKQFPISRALFSPLWGSENNAGNTIYVLQYGLLSSYDVKEKTVKQLKDHVGYFDVTPDGKNLIYDIYHDNTQTSDIELFSLNDGTSRKILDSIPHLLSFDLSYDGKKILYVKTSGGTLAYYDLDTKQEHDISNISITYFTTPPRWIGNDSQVIYQEGGDPRGWMGGNLVITDLSGNTDLFLRSNNNPAAFVFAPDEKSLLVYYGDPTSKSCNIEKMDAHDVFLIKTVPEFPFAVPVLLISIVSIIALYRMNFNK